MKLYYSPGACSLASRIIIHEAGIDASFDRVDLKVKLTEHGDDFSEINPKGCVPTLILDDGDKVTENIAVLALLADRHPDFGLDAHLGRTRLLEMLSFLSTELHIAFKPYYHSKDEAELAEASRQVARKLDLLAEHIRELYLFGPHFTVADAYLFAMLRWAVAFGIPMQPQLIGYFERVAERPMVRKALAEEGLDLPEAVTEVAPEAPVAA
jgi:glutathione S-transferase